MILKNADILFGSEYKQPFGQGRKAKIRCWSPQHRTVEQLFVKHGPRTESIAHSLSMESHLLRAVLPQLVSKSIHVSPASNDRCIARDVLTLH